MKVSRPPVFRRHPLVVAVLLGLSAGLCTPPLPLGPAIPLVLAVSLLALAPLSGWAAFRWGLAWGLALNLSTLLWIRNVMSVGPVLAIGGGLVLLMGYLSVFSGLWAWAWSRLRPRGLAWAWPFVFAGIEILRGFGQMSFPWSHVGYDLGDWPILLQGAAWVGVHGTGLAIALVAVGLWKALPAGRWAVRAALVLAVGAWIAFGAWRLSRPQEGRTWTVALVQPSIPQTRKWGESYFRAVMDSTYATLGRLSRPVDLVVLPETAIPDFWSLRPWEASRFQRFADSSGAQVLLGALDFDRDPAAPRGAWIRNAAFFLEPGGQPRRYDKIRLVPFSERLPFDDVFPVLNYVDLGEGDFAPGKVLPVHTTRGIPWSPTICYELVYPDFARQAAAGGARALVDITNDGWFGRSMGPLQHWNIERFRAVESGLPLVRAANTGISGVVDDRGRVVTRSDLMDDTLLVATVREGSPSFAARHGGAIEALLALLGALGLAACFLPRAREPAV